MDDISSLKALVTLQSVVIMDMGRMLIRTAQPVYGFNAGDLQASVANLEAHMQMLVEATDIVAGVDGDTE